MEECLGAVDTKARRGEQILRILAGSNIRDELCSLSLTPIISKIVND
jgi:hypothetical protein